jgi:glycosyltransferase involved in cell wall biosynthesis
MTVSLIEPEMQAKPNGDAPAGAAQCTAPPKPYPVEFAGWLPCFRFFGDCGHHPQFAHTEAPPDGYQFVCSNPKAVPRAAGRPRGGLLAPALRLLRIAWLVLRPIGSVLHHAQTIGVWQSLQTLACVVRLFFMLRRARCKIAPTVQFLRTRHFPSQVLVPPSSTLMFLTSIPFTFNQRPWVVEIEDPTTLFFPFHNNGGTAYTSIQSSPYLPVVKALLESDSCRGIITHMRSTAEALPKLFASDLIAAKTCYVPYGTTLPPKAPERPSSGPLDLLFTCSWHQVPESFFWRGGLDLLRAFETIHERYPHVRLTLRTRLPAMSARFRQVLEKCWVRVIDRYLPDDDMDKLMRGTHIFVLPAARIHVVSVLRAMAYGQAVVVSDGWGFREYVEHDRNGMVVPGRYGKASWMDDAGMLREDYYGAMFNSDAAVARGLIETISMLVEDHELRRRLGQQARRDVATRYNLANWNRGLQEALNRATGQAG